MITALEKPRARGLFVLTAHPEGCRVLVDRQRARAAAAFEKPLAAAEGKTALVIGSTTFGYGSSTLIALREAGFSRVIGLGYETPPSFRKGKPAVTMTGWYLTHALHEAYDAQRTYFADGFADTTRDRVVDDLVAAGVEIDLVVYSVAAPRRTHLGEEWSSALAVIGEPLDVLGLDFKSGEHKPIQLWPASELQIEQTRRVMGGDDLDLWINALLYSGRLARGCTVTALSYIGPEFEALRRIYWDGALGGAKKHVDATIASLNARLSDRLGGKALTAVNPAVVTGASVAIPAMLKYIADYLGVVDDGTGVYDDPLDVGVNFTRALYGEGEPWRQMLDEDGRLRLDAHELDADLQARLLELWKTSEPGPTGPTTTRGLEIFRREYNKLYGWDVEGVDYSVEADFAPELGEAQGVVHLITE